MNAMRDTAIGVALGLVLFISVGIGVSSCGKDDGPNPPAPPISKTFEFKNDSIEIKGFVKTVTVEEAKVAVGLAIRDLEK